MTNTEKVATNAKVNNNTILNEGEYIVWTFGDNGDPYNTKKEALAARKEFFGHLYASEAEMDRYIPVHREIWIRECGLESNIPVCDYEDRLKGIKEKEVNGYKINPYRDCELKDRSAWTDGENVIGKNYRAKNDYENAPIGAVAIFPVHSTKLSRGEKVEQWKKIGKDEWIEIDAKTYCQLYDQYNGGKQTYELVDNGQFPYGYQYLEDSGLFEEIADKVKDHLFWGEDCEDDFVVYEGESGNDYTLSYTFNWLDNELTYQITSDDGYLKGETDTEGYMPMDQRICEMMCYVEDWLLEIDRREWEKNNNNN